MNYSQSIIGLLVLLLVLAYVFHLFLNGPSQRNFNKIMQRLNETVNSNPFFRNKKKINQDHYAVQFEYCKKYFLLNCKFEILKYYRNPSYEMSFSYTLRFDQPKKITKLELYRLPKYLKFFYYIATSTTDITGNEDRSFRVIYEHSGKIDKQILRTTIERIVPLKELNNAKNIHLLHKIIITPNEVIIHTGRPIEDPEQIKKLFDLLIAISDTKVSKMEVALNPDEAYALKLMNNVLTAINSHSIKDTGLFSETFVKKFKLILEENRAEEQKRDTKITISISPNPQVKIRKKSSNMLQVTITDSFPIKSTPYTKEYENPPGTRSTWTLLIDAQTDKISGMEENIWGNFNIQSNS